MREVTHALAQPEGRVKETGSHSDFTIELDVGHAEEFNKGLGIHCNREDYGTNPVSKGWRIYDYSDELTDGDWHEVTSHVSVSLNTARCAHSNVEAWENVVVVVSNVEGSSDHPRDVTKASEAALEKALKQL